MLTDSQVRWVRHQPLAVQLSAVDAVWHTRADAIVMESDRLWGVGREQDALDEVVEFAEDAATVYESLSGSSDFSRFARGRVQDIASGAILAAAVVWQVSLGAEGGLDSEPLQRVCERLGLAL